MARLVVPLYGDTHLSKFGVFGSSEDELLFDLGDVDETPSSPFEHDVKCMAPHSETHQNHAARRDRGDRCGVSFGSEIDRRRGSIYSYE